MVTIIVNYWLPLLFTLIGLAAIIGGVVWKKGQVIWAGLILWALAVIIFLSEAFLLK